LLESIDILGSIRDNAPIESSPTLNLFIDFVCVATGAACLPQNALSCVQCGRLRGNFHFATISNTQWRKKAYYDVCSSWAMYDFDSMVQLARRTQYQ